MSCEIPWFFATQLENTTAARPDLGLARNIIQTYRETDEYTMNVLQKTALSLLLIVYLSASSVCHADNISLHRFDIGEFDINGTHIGDQKDSFIQNMDKRFISRTVKAKPTQPDSLIYNRPVSCLSEKDGNTRCNGKFAEMKRPGETQKKKFIKYKDVIAEFNSDSRLAFLSTITTTGYSNKKACLAELSTFYKQAANRQMKPAVIYPRNQLDIYYIKIDEQPFTTRLLGKLDSAFSMVWQKQRGDWSAFYSVDFGCRNNGYMVVNETLYDKARKSAPGSRLQVSRLRTKD